MVIHIIHNLSYPKRAWCISCIPGWQTTLISSKSCKTRKLCHKWMTTYEYRDSNVSWYDGRCWAPVTPHLEVHPPPGQRGQGVSPNPKGRSQKSSFSAPESKRSFIKLRMFISSEDKNHHCWARQSLTPTTWPSRLVELVRLSRPACRSRPQRKYSKSLHQWKYNEHRKVKGCILQTAQFHRTVSPEAIDAAL